MTVCTAIISLPRSGSHYYSDIVATKYNCINLLEYFEPYTFVSYHDFEFMKYSRYLEITNREELNVVHNKYIVHDKIRYLDDYLKRHSAVIKLFTNTYQHVSDFLHTKCNIVLLKRRNLLHQLSSLKIDQFRRDRGLSNIPYLRLKIDKELLNFTKQSVLRLHNIEAELHSKNVEFDVVYYEDLDILSSYEKVAYAQNQLDYIINLDKIKKHMSKFLKDNNLTEYKDTF